MFGLLIVIAGIIYLTKVLSDNFLYKYLDHFKSKLVINLLVGFHWGLSIVIAFTLPDYLRRYNFFRNAFEDSGIWVNAATLCLFFISLILIGLLLDAAFYLGFKEGNAENTNKKDGHGTI
jgi:hypothetical protein